MRFLLPVFGIGALLFVAFGACVLLSALISVDNAPKPWDDDKSKYPARTLSDNERL